MGNIEFHVRFNKSAVRKIPSCAAQPLRRDFIIYYLMLNDNLLWLPRLTQFCIFRPSGHRYG